MINVVGPHKTVRQTLVQCYAFALKLLIAFSLFITFLLNVTPFLNLVKIQNLGRYDSIPANYGGKNVIAQNSDKLKIILLWNELAFYSAWNFGSGQAPFKTHGCPEQRCFIHERDTKRTPFDDAQLTEIVDKSDAILVHAPTLTRSMGYPAVRHPWQRWIFASREPPSAFALHEPWFARDVFNWTMSYLRSSSIYWGYGRVTLSTNTTTSTYDSATTLPHTFPTLLKINGSARLPKPKLAVWFVSNCGTLGGREHYYRELIRHMPVDVYGKCGSDPELTCGSNGVQPEDLSQSRPFDFASDNARRSSCLDMAANVYAFYLSFENSLCQDYVTEKFFEPLSRSIIPVVYGDADYRTYAPPGTYIDARLYASPRALARYLTHLYARPELYYALLDAKTTLLHQRSLIVSTHGHFYATGPAMCALCAKLHERQSVKEEHIKDVVVWWKRGRCKKYCLPWGLCTRTNYDYYTQPTFPI